MVRVWSGALEAGALNETNRLAGGYQVEIDEKFKPRVPAAGR
jgi:hypothetical protein